MNSNSRSGVVLVVIIGISAILVALAFTLALRVQDASRSVPQIQKAAQAFLMMQAARVYLNGRWLDGSVNGHKYLAAQGDRSGAVLADRGVFFFNDDTSIKTVSQKWTIGATPALSTFGFNAVACYPLQLIQGAGWFAVTANQVGAAPGDPPVDFAVLGAGGPGFREAQSRVAKKPTAAGDPSRNLGFGDVRLYGIYTPASDTFRSVGFGYLPGIANAPSAMKLLDPVD